MKKYYIIIGALSVALIVSISVLITTAILTHSSDSKDDVDKESQLNTGRLEQDAIEVYATEDSSTSNVRIEDEVNILTSEEVDGIYDEMSLAEKLSYDKEHTDYSDDSGGITDGGPAAVIEYWDAVVDIPTLSPEELKDYPEGLGSIVVFDPDGAEYMMYCYRALQSYLGFDIKDIVQEAYVSKLDYIFGYYYYYTMEVYDTIYLVYIDDSKIYIKLYPY